MREIKFRLWDKNLGMDYNPKLGMNNNDLNNQFATALGEIMQYTGLKDRNQVDVYLGDIVKCSSGCPHEVVWQHSFFGMPMIYLSGLNEGYSWTETEEVIGNIYQNPELIK